MSTKRAQQQQQQWCWSGCWSWAAFECKFRSCGAAFFMDIWWLCRGRDAKQRLPLSVHCILCLCSLAVTRADRCKRCCDFSLSLSFTSSPRASFRGRNPSWQSNVANQVCPNRYGMWSSFQDAPCRKLAQTLPVPFPYAIPQWDMLHGNWYLVSGCIFPAQPRRSLRFETENNVRFFWSVLSRKSDTTSRLAAQWEKCPKPLYGNYAHIYMRMSNGGQKTGSKVAMQLSNIMSAQTAWHSLLGTKL